MRKYNVAIADDLDMYLSEMTELIQSDDELELIGKATNGEELCDIINQKNPDIILMDIIMPKLDGFGVMDRVLRHSDQPNHPIFIIVTSIMQETITRDAFSHGASYYIVKPFHQETVLNRIKYYAKCGTMPVSASVSPAVQTKPALEKQPDLESDITSLLYQLGIPNHLRGFAYLRDAVMLSVQNIEMLSSVTKILYHEIARLHNSTNLRVERAIRHAIDLASREGSLSNIEELTGFTFRSKKIRPSNSELIAFLTDVFRLKYKNTKH